MRSSQVWISFICCTLSPAWWVMVRATAACSVRCWRSSTLGGSECPHACPPGLAKKNNGCLPPGQAKKLYNVGQRFPLGYGQPWNYNQIPYNMRTQYGFNPGYNYCYGDGYVYRVDPATMLISQVVSAVLR